MNERRRLESILGCGPYDRLTEGAVVRWRGKEYIIGTADEAELLAALQECGRVEIKANGRIAEMSMEFRMPQS